MELEKTGLFFAQNGVAQSANKNNDEEFKFIFKPESFGGKNNESSNNTTMFDSWDA